MDARRTAVSGQLIDWLKDHALAIWSDIGVDRVGGGFFEKLDLRGAAVEEPRRARVVARQIYVFATAALNSWITNGDTLVEHGLDFLLGKMRMADGRFAASVRADGAVVNGAFDLYEHAFILMAFAAAAECLPAREAQLRFHAEDLLKSMRGRWGHPSAGFEEAFPRSLPLKSNPHMHLLEAALAWAELSSGDARASWDALAAELVKLCTEHFVDADSGALREYFDGDWRPMPDSSGRLVEPGHQFEWAWLLMRWARLNARPDVETVAIRLLKIGEMHGVDAARGVAVDALQDDFAIISATAKLWPQTERVKAWYAACTSAADPDLAALAQHKLIDALNGLSLYLLPSPRGLWNEQMGADHSFVTQDCRASSLYHIVCALDTVGGAASTIGNGGQAVAPRLVG